MAAPTSAPTVPRLSCQELGFVAEMMAMGMAMTIESAQAISPIWMVGIKRGWSVSQTGCRDWTERPRSPVKTFPSQVMYWMTSGRSNPCSRRISSSVSSLIFACV